MPPRSPPRKSPTRIMSLGFPAKRRTRSCGTRCRFSRCFASIRRGSGDHGRARLRFLQHLRPSASARPMSNTAVLENALLPLRPLLAREDVTELVINKAGVAAIETRDGWYWETLPDLNEKSLHALARAAAALTPQAITQPTPE